MKISNLWDYSDCTVQCFWLTKENQLMSVICSRVWLLFVFYSFKNNWLIIFICLGVILLWSHWLTKKNRIISVISSVIRLHWLNCQWKYHTCVLTILFANTFLSVCSVILLITSAQIWIYLINIKSQLHVMSPKMSSLHYTFTSRAS